MMKGWLLATFVALGALAQADLADDVRAGVDLEFDLKSMNYQMTGVYSETGTVTDEEAPPTRAPKAANTLDMVLDTAALGAPFSIIVPLAGSKLSPTRVRWTTDVSPNQNVTIVINGQPVNVTIRRIRGMLTNDLAPTGPLYSALCNQGYNVALADTNSNAESWFDVTAWVNNSPFLPINVAYRDIDNVGLGGVPRGVLVPDGFSVVEGAYAGGTLASLAASDDDRVYIASDELASTAILEVVGHSAAPAPGSLTIRAELRAARNDLTQFIDAFHFGTSTWSTVDVSTSTLGDSIRTATLVNPGGTYVQAGTREIRTRIRWVPQNDLDAADGWSEAVDECVWISQP